ncbi:hypothetical protein [Paraconexibacter algicola]|uniref:Secreted protein n=1 Tax=Paraconexibacter algicola TaxID=2133960 RepID=A0A2T4UCJ4_9ACTN|nr:hypothetical protein [Paraconexibacter algicola]PTL54922.1 hypothetical protein C7Y72_20320 [Paraconexibacter algicola]
MRRLLLLAVATAVLATPAGAAAQDRSCGSVKRPFTDARVAVSVTKGSVSCRTARAVLGRYWRSSTTAFSRSVTVSYRGVRWRCRPTAVMSGANAWGCSTPGQRSIVAGVEVG